MKSLFCIAAVAAAQLLIPAHAEVCGKLIAYGTIPLTQIDGAASEFVPVEIAGVPKLMLLDTGSGVTTLSKKTAAELHLESNRSTELEVYDVTGAKANQFVTASLEIGNLRGGNLKFMLGTPYLGDFGDPRVVGLLGADILRNFDLSIDFGAHTFTLVSQDHCDGQVVYWPERPIAVIPFKLDNGAAIIFPVALDGHEIKAQLDTGASTTTLERGKAERSFDLVLGSADTPVVGDPNSSPALTTWKHRFKSLSLAGIEVSNPEIHIIPDKISEKINTWSTGSMLDNRSNSVELPRMLLGMDVLKHLHIYIAYREKNLYITPASQPAAGSPPPPAAANGAPPAK
jgi:predicted aspartyl protease